MEGWKGQALTWSQAHGAAIGAFQQFSPAKGAQRQGPRRARGMDLMLPHGGKGAVGKRERPRVTGGGAAFKGSEGER